MPKESVFAQELGIYLRQQRIRQGLKQDVVAARTGLSQSKVSDIERGVQLPTREEVLRIADTVQVDLTHIFRIGGYEREPRLDDSETYSALFQVFSDPYFDMLMTPPGEAPVVHFVQAWRAYLECQKRAWERDWTGAATSADNALVQLRIAADWMMSYVLDARAEAQMRLAKRFEADVSYRLLRERMADVQDHFLWGQRYFHEAELARIKGNWRESLERFRQATYEFDALEDRELAENQNAIVQRKIGIVYLQQGQWELAREPLRASLSRIEAVPNPYEHAKVHMAQGWLALYAGDITRSLEHRKAAIDLAYQISGPRGEYLKGQAHLYYALSLRERGGERDREEALKHLALAGPGPREGSTEIETTTVALGIIQIEIDRRLWGDRGALDWAKIQEQVDSVATRTGADRLEEGYVVMLGAIVHFERALEAHQVEETVLETGLANLDQAIRSFTRREHKGYLAEAHYLKAYYLMRFAQVDGQRLYQAVESLDAAMKALRAYSHSYPLLEPRVLALQTTLDILRKAIPAPRVEDLAKLYQPHTALTGADSVLSGKHVRRLFTYVYERLRRSPA